MTPYRGTNGYYQREDDEGYVADVTGRPVRMQARYPGRCAETGARIKPGDLIDYDKRLKRSVLVTHRTESDDRYVSHVIRTSGGEFYRNKAGRCEDAPCCGCCTI